MIYPFSTNKIITQTFGQTNAAITGGTHWGTDYAIPMNTPLRAMMSGTVAAVGYDNISGNYILVNSGQYQYGYFHMARVDVGRGQQLAEGQQVGLAGSTGASTGPHLHLQLKRNGQLIDPEAFLQNAAASAPARKSNEEIATEVIRGNWGNGADRVNRLRAAGYDPAAVQAIVNQKLGGRNGSAGKSNEEIATEVIRGNWGNGADRVNRLRAAGYDPAAVQAIVNRRLL